MDTNPRDNRRNKYSGDDKGNTNQFRTIMKLQYKQIIEIEIEAEYPLLGVDIYKVVDKEFGPMIKEAGIIALKDGRKTQTIKIGDKNFKVTIKDRINTYTRHSNVNPIGL